MQELDEPEGNQTQRDSCNQDCQNTFAANTLFRIFFFNFLVDGYHSFCPYGAQSLALTTQTQFGSIR